MVSPPMSCIWFLFASRNKPSANFVKKSSLHSGMVNARVNATGVAPMAAKSDIFTAKDLYPIALGSVPLKK